MTMNQVAPQCPDAEQLYRHLKESIAQTITVEQRMPHLIGVYTGGAWIAERLHADLKLTTPLGFLSSQFHRDDYNQRGLPTNSKPTTLTFDNRSRRPRATCCGTVCWWYSPNSSRSILCFINDYEWPTTFED
jgi:hypothetical protein